MAHDSAIHIDVTIICKAIHWWQLLCFGHAELDQGKLNALQCVVLRFAKSTLGIKAEYLQLKIPTVCS